MSNVITLTLPAARQPLPQRLAGLIHCFAHDRRFGEDVFWLKENAELLSILECTGQRFDPAQLAPLQGFYDSVRDRLSFFPQYYRFLLSITLDLEDLGLTGDHGVALVDWACDQGLVEAELSDLQRAEACRLMLRRGRDPMAHDQGLQDRLRRFINRPEIFALPNKKAAYELTHIVFYLSEYGRRDPQLDPLGLLSLDYAGTLAYLDQNVDLLAEICIALRYAGQTPPTIWENWVTREAQRFTLTEGEHAHVQDNYHEYLTINWLLAELGEDSFLQTPGFCRAQFTRGPTWHGPLRAMSESLLAMGTGRSGRWAEMKPLLQDALDETGRDILQEAEASCPAFEDFFHAFARAAQVQPRAWVEGVG